MISCTEPPHLRQGYATSPPDSRATLSRPPALIVWILATKFSMCVSAQTTTRLCHKILYHLRCFEDRKLAHTQKLAQSPTALASNSLRSLSSLTCSDTPHMHTAYHHRTMAQAHQLLLLRAQMHRNRGPALLRNRNNLFDAQTVPRRPVPSFYR